MLTLYRDLGPGLEVFLKNDEGMASLGVREMETERSLRSVGLEETQGPESRTPSQEQARGYNSSSGAHGVQTADTGSPAAAGRALHTDPVSQWPPLQVMVFWGFLKVASRPQCSPAGKKRGNAL